MFGAASILDDDTLMKLASVGPSIVSVKDLEAVVGEGWVWLGTYGDSLLAKIAELSIPAMVRKPPPAKPPKAALPAKVAKPCVEKRTLEVAEDDDEGARAKRTRRDQPPPPVAGPSRVIAASSPTAVTGPPVLVPSSIVPATPARPSAQNPYASLPHYYQYPGATPYYLLYPQWPQHHYFSPIPSFYQPMYSTHVPIPTPPATPLPRNPDSDRPSDPN